MCRKERARVPVRALAALGAAAVVVYAVLWLLTETAFVPIAMAVVGVLCVAGVALVVRELRHPAWGPVVRRPAKRVHAFPPALPAREPLAVEKPKPVLTGVVLESRETVG